MAVLAAGLVIHGVQMGPTLFRQDQHILYVLIVASLLPRLVAAGILTILGTRVAALVRIRGDILAPIVIVISMVGVYAINREIRDVLVALVFSYVGYGMERHGFSRVALIIALVLGANMELTFHQTLDAGGLGTFVTRPIALVLFVVAMLTLFGPLVLKLWRRMGAGRGATA
jgi:putative tricarboxylic transport membrane protein